MIQSIISRITGHPHRKAVLLNSRQIVKALSVYIGERHTEKIDNLSRAASFISAAFRQNGSAVSLENYEAGGVTVTNVIAEIRGERHPDEIILIGAHYDTVQDSSGANDNATGIAALIECFRLLSHYRSNRTIRFAAFTLEEPPFFGTEYMGSFVHAAGCKKRGEDIRLMVSLDMLGFGSPSLTQTFPHEAMQKKYPEKGDYLAVAALPSNSQSAFIFKKAYNRFARKKIYEVVAPASLAGINDSDHASFHKNGYRSILVTDTGVYRNVNYHTEDDSFSRVNFNFLADNIINISRAVHQLASLREL